MHTDCAGTKNLVVTMLAVAYFGFYRQTLNLSWVYDSFVPLLSAATLFSFALSAILYAASLQRGALCAKGGCTGVLEPAQLPPSIIWDPLPCQLPQQN